MVEDVLTSFLVGLVCWYDGWKRGMNEKRGFGLRADIEKK